MTFGQQLKLYRTIDGKTQTEVGRLARVPTSSISRIERGAGCTIDTAFALARAVKMKTIVVD